MEGALPVERELSHMDGVRRVGQLGLVSLAVGQLMRRHSQTPIGDCSLVAGLVQSEVLACETTTTTRRPEGHSFERIHLGKLRRRIRIGAN